MSDFRKTKWFFHNETTSTSSMVMVPRISMIAAIDTDGEVYVTLTQSNSNSSIMEMYFRHLVKVLDRKSRYWRNHTVILLDGAPYHTSKVTKEILDELEIPTMYLGPHSYDAAPIELFFAWFKSADINPRKVSQGKK